MSENHMSWTAYWSETPNTWLVSSTSSTFNRIWCHLRPLSLWLHFLVTFIVWCDFSCAHPLARLLYLDVFLRHFTFHILCSGGHTSSTFSTSQLIMASSWHRHNAKYAWLLPSGNMLLHLPGIPTSLSLVYVFPFSYVMYCYFYMYMCLFFRISMI